VATYVDKLIRYESGQDDGAWRNHLLFVGDDEHGEGDVVRGWESDHTQHSEFLIRSMVPPSFDVERIYTVEYPTVYNPEIRVNEKPLAEKRLLLDGIREGAAIINYIGHGNNTTWCHEYLFNTSKHLALLPANNRPSVYIAATCSWAEIDLPIGLALPQQLLTLPRGGAIGVMAATRNTTSGGNDRFARNLYPALFAAWSDSLAPRITVAEAMRIAKNASISSNDELYLYLGDPSMLPGLPAQGGRITSVRRPDGSETDTLRTLELATIEGADRTFQRHRRHHHRGGRGVRGRARGGGAAALLLRPASLQWNHGAGFPGLRKPGRPVVRGQGRVRGGAAPGTFHHARGFLGTCRPR
jgi:hypothetical protein